LFRQTVVLEDWPPEGHGEIVQFKLILKGNLPPDKRATSNAKQRIRREIHPQLRVLWEQHAWLKSGLGAHSSGHPETGIERLANNYRRCGFRFAPLIRKDQHACKLDILVLRRDEPHRLFTGAGDLDNRVKTLIDGLRMPQQCSELNGAQPTSDEDPFFVLLEDDRSILEFRVETDRLLVPPEPDEPERDVFAVIGVHVTTPIGYQIASYGGAFY
jgi:hypothetical protein